MARELSLLYERAALSEIFIHFIPFFKVFNFRTLCSLNFLTMNPFVISAVTSCAIVSWEFFVCCYLVNVSILDLNQSKYLHLGHFIDHWIPEGFKLYVSALRLGCNYSCTRDICVAYRKRWRSFLLFNTKLQYRLI